MVLVHPLSGGTVWLLLVSYSPRSHSDGVVPGLGLGSMVTTSGFIYDWTRVWFLVLDWLVIRACLAQKSP